MSKRGRTKKAQKRPGPPHGPSPRRGPVPERADAALALPTSRASAPPILEIVPDPMRDLAPPPALASDAGIERPVDHPETAASDNGTSRPAHDEPSVPPAGDLDVRFFDGGLGFDALDSDPHAARRAMFAAAAPRRARLAKYVQGAVAFSAFLCVVALAKVALFHGDSAISPASAASLADPPVRSALLVPPPTEPVAVAAAAAPAADPPPLAAAAVADPPPADPAPAAPAPSDPVAAASAPADPVAAKTEDPPAAPAAAPSPAAAEGTVAADNVLADPAARAREAARQRENARAALERGALKQAIAAGERSVALDGTDGESWLILGAAYQQGGDLNSARRSYRACVDRGRRGPRIECEQMLR